MRGRRNWYSCWVRQWMSNVQRVTLTATGFFQPSFILVPVETFEPKEEGTGLSNRQSTEGVTFRVKEVEALPRPLRRGTFTATPQSPDQTQSLLLGHWTWDSFSVGHSLAHEGHSGHIEVTRGALRHHPSVGYFPYPSRRVYRATSCRSSSVDRLRWIDAAVGRCGTSVCLWHGTPYTHFGDTAINASAHTYP